jgi:3'-5' exoribonuclease
LVITPFHSFSSPRLGAPRFRRRGSIGMSRRYINQLGEHETLDQVFIAAEKQLRTNRNGNLYLQLRLADRTGSVNAMLWNANDSIYRSFNAGDYVHVEGCTQYYNGNIQIIVSAIAAVDAGEVDEADFVVLSSGDTDRLVVRLGEMLRGMASEPLRGLAECYLADQAFMDRFVRAPAGVKNHHAYPGGLLEHVVNLMEVVLLVATRYPQLDADLLLVGAFLHDSGKVDELIFDREIAYTDEGQLIGHVVLGVRLFDGKLQEYERLTREEFPRELRNRVSHMIVSHHGQYEFGSPKVPMTLEATALHYLDNLDAKLHSFDQLMRDDVNVDSAWTPFQANLGRKLFKGERK